MTVDKILVEKKDLLTSVVKKIASSKSDKLLLVFEEGSDISSSLVSIDLLREKAVESGKRLVILTKDVATFPLCEKLGITCVKDETLLSSKSWNEPMPSSETKKLEVSSTADKASQPVNILADSKIPSLVGSAVSATSTPEIRKEGTFSFAVGSDINTLQDDVTNVSTPSAATSVGKPDLKKNKIIGIDFSKLHGAVIATGTKDGQEVFVKRGGIRERFEKLSGTFDFKKLLENKLLVIGIAIGVLVGVLWFLYYYFLLPKVVITLYPQNVDVSFTGEIIARDDTNGIVINHADKTYILSSKTESYLDEKALKTSDSASTTARSEVGDYANGVVTLYNSSEDNVTVPAGTTITSGALQYGTVDSVTVPRQTTTIEGTTKGSATVNIRAVALGEGYNLPSGSRFVIQGFSELEGQTVSGISGGSKREVTTVGENDVTTLGVELENDLKSQLKTKFIDLHKNDGWVLVEDSIVFEPAPGEGVERFSTDIPIGSEGSIVNVTVSMGGTAVYYNDDELDSMIQSVLRNDYEQKVISGEANDAFQMNLSSEYYFEVSVKEVSGGDIILSLEAHGIMVTTLDKEKIAQELKGLSFSQGIAYLDKLPHMSRTAEVKYIPENYLERIKHFPFNVKRIIFEIKQ
ncbi:hypothetical protein JW962_00160 [Candidatus Dojkabacteria bacterium]|nr:hypothetical protein [Candidatus Dojkabacteria bacterium]